MGSDPGLLVQILDELKAARADQHKLIADHDARIVALEKKTDRRSMFISAVTAVLVAAASAFAGN